MQRISTQTLALAYIATLVVFGAVDAVWLGTMANRLYRPVMAEMLATDFRAMPAILFYLLYVAGLTFLAVRPALASGRLMTALTNGAIVGFTAYATYDLTNQATLKNWSTTLTVADLVWGTLLSATASAAGFWISRRLSSDRDAGPDRS